jgi:methanogenic corrinoid protein MtbC1
MESLPQEHSTRDSASMASAPPECELLPVFALAEAANDTRMAQLARTIEQEIIPRLMLAHRVDLGLLAKPNTPGQDISRDDVQHFAKLVLAQDDDPALAAIQAHRAKGASIEALYLELLAPTARYLGELWTEDLCSFTDVTIGLGRLQRLLRELSPAFGRTVEHPSDGRRVLLLPSPGEQHTFGLVMVGEFFRRAGWDVSGGAWTAGADAGALVGTEWFDAIGFSLGAEIHLRRLAENVRAVKQAACNQNIVVLVGGPLFAEHPEFVAQIGADGMTIDGREAPSLAERLIAEASTLRAVDRAMRQRSGPSR